MWECILTINTKWCMMKIKCCRQKNNGWSVLQKCAKNAQVQNNPTLKWGTCDNGKYVVA